MAQPRWIKTYRVDSQAMLSAYLHWLGHHHGDRDIYNIGDLPIVMHQPAEAPAPQGTVIVICNHTDCPRCRLRWGGYVSRWFSPYWSDAYMKTRRLEGCWKSGEEEVGPYINPDWDAEYILSERGSWP